MSSTPSSSFLLGNESTPVQPQQPKRGLTTGRKILAYPNGNPSMMRSVIQGFGNLSPLKPANVASSSDFTRDRSLSVAEVFEKTTAHAIMYEEIGVMVVKDASLLQGFSPASIGSSGQMPIIGDDYYVYPIAEGSSAIDPDKLNDLLSTLRDLTSTLQQQRVSTSRAAGVVAPAATGNQKTWGLNAVEAITAAFTGKNVRVAVIDTGIDPNHPDLSSKIAATWTFDGGPVNDEVGHGTHVAGTIAGARSGALAYGVAPDVRLHIAKVFGANGAGGTSAELVAAVNWAIQQKCQIANMSLSSNEILPPGTHFDPAFETLAQTALQRGLILIAASGNLADLNALGQHTNVRNNPPAPIGYPANCPSVLAVGALSQDLQICAFLQRRASRSLQWIDQLRGARREYRLLLAHQHPSRGAGRRPRRVLLASLGNQHGRSPHLGPGGLALGKIGGAGGLQLWQALAINKVNSLTGLDRRDVGFGMPLAPQS